VPAAAVIPAPKVYTQVVAVKKLVVEPNEGWSSVPIATNALGLMLDDFWITKWDAQNGVFLRKDPSSRSLL